MSVRKYLQFETSLVDDIYLVVVVYFDILLNKCRYI